MNLPRGWRKSKFLPGIRIRPCVEQKFQFVDLLLCFFQSLETAQDLGVQMIACTTTLGMMGISKDTLIDGVDQLAGVSTYLAEARHGSVNLFI